MDGLRVILDAGAGGIEAERVEVVWRHGKEEIPQAARERIEERWADYVQEAQASGKSLFNGDVTRLIRPAWEGEKLVLELGKTDYKTFVVTSIRDRAWFETHAIGAIAAGLGNSVLLTKGGEAILGVRSEAVSAYAGRAHVMGGVLELLGTKALAASWEGIVRHLQNEINEEVGVDAGEMVGGPRLLGIVRDELLGQPEMLWQWEVGVELLEVGRRMKESEHCGNILLSKEGIAGGVWDQMTPVARAAWEWWRKGANDDSREAF